MTLHPSSDSLAQLTYRFFYYLDEKRFDDLLAMMKPDALWHRHGKHLHGHAEILAELKSRSPTQRTRHVITNSFIDSQDERSATVRAYMLAYRFDNGKTPRPPVALAGPLRMVLMTTRFARSGDGRWLIEEQSAVPEIEFSASPSAAG